MNIVLNQRTKKKLAMLEQSLPQALLLAGDRGVGLSTIARQIAGKNLAVFIEPLNSNANTHHELGTISVETIRLLYEQTRSKSLDRKIVIIDDADRMSLGAQAAFLKLLEEPTKNTHFILTSHDVQALLPTVRSRLQTLLVEPLTEVQTSDFLDQLGVRDGQIRRQIEYLAGGLPAEQYRLVNNESYFKERAETMGDTRTFLTGSIYERLLVVNKYHKDRIKSLQLVDNSLIVSKRSLSAKPQAAIVSQLEKLLDVREKIDANCNIRLQLTVFILR